MKCCFLGQQECPCSLSCLFSEQYMSTIEIGRWFTSRSTWAEVAPSCGLDVSGNLPLQSEPIFTNNGFLGSLVRFTQPLLHPFLSCVMSSTFLGFRFNCSSKLICITCSATLIYRWHVLSSWKKMVECLNPKAAEGWHSLLTQLSRRWLSLCTKDVVLVYFVFCLFACLLFIYISEWLSDRNTLVLCYDWILVVLGLFFLFISYTYWKVQTNVFLKVFSM